MSDRQVHLSYRGAAVLLMCYGSTKVKKGMVRLKASIDEKLDALRTPQKIQTNQVDKDKNLIYVEVPDTGPGCDDYDIQPGAVSFSEAEADNLKSAYNDILGKDGFPPKWARGVAEVEEALLSWTAEEAPTE